MFSQKILVILKYVYKIKRISYTQCFFSYPTQSYPIGDIKEKWLDFKAKDSRGQPGRSEKQHLAYSELVITSSNSKFIHRDSVPKGNEEDS